MIKHNRFVERAALLIACCTVIYGFSTASPVLAQATTAEQIAEQSKAVISKITKMIKANPDAVFVHPTALFRPMRERLGSAFPAAACGLRDGETIYVADCEVHGIVAAHNVVDRDDAGKPRCMGFVLRTGPFLIYHSGDTLWHDDIVRQVREVGCHVAFVPINGNKPERKVSGNLNGTEAAAMAKALGAIMAVPHHFEMFEFNTESPEEFTAACQRIGQPHRVLRCGERLTLSASDLP